MLLSMLQLVTGIGVVLMLAAWGVNRDTVGIVAGLLGAFSWWLVAYGLFNIETVGTKATDSEPAIALLAAAAGVVCIVPALVNPWEIIGDAQDQNDPMGRL